MPKKKAGKRNARNTKPNEALKQERFDSDGLWKDLINRFFWPLLEMTLPELYNDADTNKKHKPLDKEFRDILNTSDPKIHTSPHFADYVIEVPLKKGGSEWVILHYRYNNLVLADLGGEELQTSDNPFGLALYAAKCALEAKEEHQKYTYLRTLTGLLTERGWSMEDKRDLALFIERFLSLKDEALKERYWEYRQQLTKEGKVMYESFLKDVEIKKVKEKLANEIAERLLAKGVALDVVAESAGLSLERIRSIAGQNSAAK